MNIFKTLVKSYKIFKVFKNKYCKNLSNSLHNLTEQARLDRLEIEMEDYEEFKRNFIEGKITTTHKTTKMFMNIDTTSEIYKNIEKFESFMIQQLINDVDSGKITHREFFKKMDE